MSARIYIYTFVLAGAALAGLLAACRAGEKPAATTQPASAGATSVPTAPPRRSTDSWLIYRGDTGMTGHTHATISDTPKLLWRFKTRDAIRSTPVVRDGVAYVGSHDGYVYAIDLRSGRKRWAFKADRAADAPPLLLKELLIVGDDDGKLYALDLRTGRPRWTAETGGKINAAPNVATLADGKRCVIVGSHDGKLYAFDAATGKQQWSYDTLNYVNGAAAIIDLDGQPHAVFGGCDSKLRIVNVADGKLTADVDLKTFIPATVAVADGRVYAATFDAGLVTLDLPELKPQWRFPPEDQLPPPTEDNTKRWEWTFASPAVGDGKVIFGTQDGNLYCLDGKDGRKLWTHRAEAAIDASAVIVGSGEAGRVIVGSDDGRLYMLNLATGAVVWKERLGQPITMAAAVVDGLILVGCDDGTLYAFGARP